MHQSSLVPPLIEDEGLLHDIERYYNEQEDCLFGNFLTQGLAASELEVEDFCLLHQLKQEAQYLHTTIQLSTETPLQPASTTKGVGIAMEWSSCITPSTSCVSQVQSPRTIPLHESTASRNASVHDNNESHSFNDADVLPKRLKLAEPATVLPARAKTQIMQTQVRTFGERIAALQRLVSPFGKTDTASVLLETIGYIKFLHEQVQVLSSPYMMSTKAGKIPGNVSLTSQGGEAGTDLRSRGLRLVPISCTMNVANKNGADYWTSTTGRCS